MSGAGQPPAARCVLTNFTAHSHTQLNSAGGGGGAGGAGRQSPSSFSLIKPERPLFFTANYVEITKTIKHLVVIPSLSRRPRCCDRLMHCGWGGGGGGTRSRGQRRANRWIYNCAFSRPKSDDHCPQTGPTPPPPQISTKEEEEQPLPAEEVSDSARQKHGLTR